MQFHLRDAAAATEDLAVLLDGLTPLTGAVGALLFTCNGRGRRFFGSPDHDAAAIGAALGTGAIGGFFCAGEIGPIGGANHLHGYTASAALLSSPLRPA